MRRSVEVVAEDPDIIVPPEELIIAAAGYGRWQILITLILCLSIVIHVMNSSLEPIHHMTGWWCEKPETLRSWTDSEWISYSHVNATRRGFTEKLMNERFRGCYVYKYNFSELRNTSYDHRPVITDQIAIQCANIKYSQKYGRTIAEKYDKACDTSLEKSVWHFMNIFGEVLGYIVMGCLCDRVGRRPVLLISYGMIPVTGIALAFSPNYTMYVISRAAHGFFHGGLVVSFIMVVEITNNVWRTRITAVAVLSYAFAIGVTPILFTAVNSIDDITLLVNVPSALLFLAGTRCLPESPAWLFATRDSTRLKDVIVKAARINRVPLPNDFHVIYVEYTDVEKQLPKRRPGFWSIFQAPEVACEITGLGYLISLSGLIFGSAQAKLVYEEKRIDHWYSIVGLDVMSGLISGQLCVLMMGHRRFLYVSVFLILVTTVALMVNLREDYITTTGPETTVLAANVFAVSLTLGAILNYGVRTVPTLLRGTYLGIWGTLWVTFIWLGTHKHLNYPGISSTAVITILLAALATLNVRDLLWRELPDTVNDAMNFKDKPKPKRWSLTETHLVAGH